MKPKKTESIIIDRREFLKLSAFAAAGFTLFELPFHKVLGVPSQRTKWQSFVEKRVMTTCQLCPGACGLSVRTIDGFPVSVSGNPLHPINSGKLCPKGLATLQTYYHPARIQGPQIKRGSKFEPIAWTDALNLIGEELDKIRKEGQPQKVVLIHQGLTGLTYHLAKKFTTLYGTPNFIGLDGNEGVNLANAYTFGSYQGYAYDLENTNFILSFGARLLDAWPSPIYAQSAISKMRAVKRDAVLIQIEPRCSTTAARANKWIPIRPGTEGALALGIAYILIKEKFYDASFIEAHTVGFEKFSRVVLEKYHPQIVSGITGISTEEIIALAKNFANTTPAVALIDGPVTQYTNGVFNAVMVNALNALKGNIDQPGGVLKQRKLFYPEFEKEAADEVAETGVLAKRIDNPIKENPDPKGFQNPLGLLNERFEFDHGDYPVQLLLTYNCNPVHYTPSSQKFLQWMKRIPLTICISTIWNETAEASTLVLPEHHFLERWQDVPAPEVVPTPVIGLSQPVSEKRIGDTKHFLEILSGITSTMGEPFNQEISIPSSEESIRAYFEDLYHSKRGTIFSDVFYSTQIKVLEERGWWSTPYPSFSEFWEDLRDKGGWWDAAYTFEEWGRVLTTPSRKYEFLAKELDFSRFVKSEFSSQTENYPYYLNVYEPISFSGGSGGDIPWLLENPTAPVNTSWETYVEINPTTAKKGGIHDGDKVIVESPFGKIEAVAKYFEAAREDVLSIPLGLGRKSYHREIPPVGTNVMNIVSPLREVLSGRQALLTTMAKVYKS
ncbi:MAG TPA: molybdopterin-dependent oxidoreductase [Candidatus Brocadiaceae bacterium]